PRACPTGCSGRDRQTPPAGQVPDVPPQSGLRWVMLFPTLRLPEENKMLDELETLGTRGRLMGDRGPNRLIGLAVLVLIAAAIAFGSFFTVDQGYRGVVLRLGAFARIAERGLGLKVPFIDRVARIRVQTNSKAYDPMQAYARHQQLAERRRTVTGRSAPDQAGEVYATYGSEEGLVSRLIDRRVSELAKTVFGRFNAVEAIQMRGSLNQQVSDAIINVIDQNVVVIESVQIEDIAFSTAYEQS